MSALNCEVLPTYDVHFGLYNPQAVIIFVINKISQHFSNRYKLTSDVKAL